uniref:Putative secreted protein n=1 Tax=Anopheles marajoara TaxID=58244 RepID=A0A2M4CDZ5_9DIPT
MVPCSGYAEWKVLPVFLLLPFSSSQTTETDPAGPLHPFGEKRTCVAIERRGIERGCSNTNTPHRGEHKTVA